MRLLIRSTRIGAQAPLFGLPFTIRNPHIRFNSSKTGPSTNFTKIRLKLGNPLELKSYGERVSGDLKGKSKKPLDDDMKQKMANKKTQSGTAPAMDDETIDGIEPTHGDDGCVPYMSKFNMISNAVEYETKHTNIEELHPSTPENRVTNEDWIKDKEKKDKEMKAKFALQASSNEPQQSKLKKDSISAKGFNASKESDDRMNHRGKKKQLREPRDTGYTKTSTSAYTENEHHSFDSKSSNSHGHIKKPPSSTYREQSRNRSRSDPNRDRAPCRSESNSPSKKENVSNSHQQQGTSSHSGKSHYGKPISRQSLYGQPLSRQPLSRQPLSRQSNNKRNSRYGNDKPSMKSKNVKRENKDQR